MGPCSCSPVLSVLQIDHIYWLVLIVNPHGNQSEQSSYTVESILPPKWAILFFFKDSNRTVTLADGYTGYSCIQEESVISWSGIRKSYIYHILVPQLKLTISIGVWFVFVKRVLNNHWVDMSNPVSPADEGPSLPTKQNEEFRPFIRRLPEFKFW